MAVLLQFYSIQSLVHAYFLLVVYFFKFQIAESSTPSIRGLLSSLPAMFMALGISVTYLIGAFAPWHILSYVCAIAPFIGFVAMLFIPESPVWLNSKGKILCLKYILPNIFNILIPKENPRKL